MERELWEAADLKILDLNPDEVISPLCDAALQAEEQVQCSNLPQGLQAEATMLSEPALELNISISSCTSPITLAVTALLHVRIWHVLKHHG